jgi:DNA-directed RNA polymerase specialized sigma24 family protein
MGIRERLSEIHRQLLGGSRTASAELFSAAYDPIVGYLVKELPVLSEEERHDIAIDAMVDYLADPAKCDESRGSLWSYLCTVARRDGLDLVRKRRRRSKLLLNAADDVELWLARANYLRNDDDKIDANSILDRHGARLVTNDVEAAILRLMLSEEKETAAYARAMEISPDAADTAEIVKKAKDKMLQRLKRLGDDLEK